MWVPPYSARQLLFRPSRWMGGDGVQRLSSFSFCVCSKCFVSTVLLSEKGQKTVSRFVYAIVGCRILTSIRRRTAPMGWMPSFYFSWNVLFYQRLGCTRFLIFHFFSLFFSRTFSFSFSYISFIHAGCIQIPELVKPPNHPHLIN